MQRKEVNPAGVFFFGFGDDSDMEKLDKLLINQTISAVFTEFPSNPLLRCHNLSQLTTLAKKYNFLLIVDDTISSFANVDLLHGNGTTVDILCSSLTKVFSGRGDVLGGSLILNSCSHWFGQLKVTMDESNNLNLPELFAIDAEILEKNSRTFVSRLYKINSTALSLANWFYQRPEIERVYFPTISSCSKVMYDRVLKCGEGPGYGCLISIVLTKSYDAKFFFDSLQTCKGPSLGTDYTLVCPYVMLAHYCELDWASSYGLDSRIIRISVGLENLEDIKSKFEKAFNAAAITG